MSASNLFVVYCFDERHVKQFVYVYNGQMFFNESPRDAFEFNQTQVAKFFAKYSKQTEQNGGGFEPKMTAYSEYIDKNKTPLDQI